MEEGQAQLHKKDKSQDMSSLSLHLHRPFFTLMLLFCLVCDFNFPHALSYIAYLPVHC